MQRHSLMNTKAYVAGK